MSIATARPHTAFGPDVDSFTCVHMCGLDAVAAANATPESMPNAAIASSMLLLAAVKLSVALFE